MTSSVLPPAEAGGGAIKHADHHRDDAGKQADGQRYAARHQRSREQIPAGVVGPEQKILLLDRGAHDHLQAVRGHALDLGVVKGIGTVEVADVALIDLLGRGHGHENPLAFLMPFLDVDAHALDRIAKRDLDHIGLRIGGKTRWRAHIVGIDRGVEMRHEIWPDNADQGHEHQVVEADHGGLVGLEARPGVAPERASHHRCGHGDISHSAPSDRRRRKGCRR